MINREKGWALDNDSEDIWTRYRDQTGIFRYFKVISNLALLTIVSYRNNVSGHSTKERPLDFRGGLLADEMGLGKTLSMICLIAANLTHVPPNPFYTSSIKTTLLIVPPACKSFSTKFDFAILILTSDTSMGEAADLVRLHGSVLMTSVSLTYIRHTSPGSLNCHVFHGKNKKKSIEQLTQYDVVITTYQTLSGLWRAAISEQEMGSRSIFSVIWHRVILDEGKYKTVLTCSLLT